MGRERDLPLRLRQPRPLEALGRLVDQGELRPVIGAVLPLADVAQAHTLLEGGSAGGRPRGKIIVAVVDLSR